MVKNKNKYNIVNSLIAIGKKIHDCYTRLADIEICDDKEDRVVEIKKIYSDIREYREFENIMFSNLTKICISDEEINEVYDYIFDVYQIKDDTNFLFYYIKNYEKNVEVLRLLEKLNFMECDNDIEDNNSVKEVGAIQVIRLDELLNKNVNNSKNMDANNSGFIELMNEEDVMLLIDKIDEYLLLKSDNEEEDNLFVKKQLVRVKYDMIFLTNSLETMLFEDDYRLYPSSFVNTKVIAARDYDMNDEEIDMLYDSIRKDEILRMAEDFSQIKSYDDSELKDLLRYLVIDVWFDSVSDLVLANIFGELFIKAKNSYNRDIFEARKLVYEDFLERYKDRISKFMITENNEELENSEKIMIKKD